MNGALIEEYSRYPNMPGPAFIAHCEHIQEYDK